MEELIYNFDGFYYAKPVQSIPQTITVHPTSPSSSSSTMSISSSSTTSTYSSSTTSTSTSSLIGHDQQVKINN